MKRTGFVSHADCARHDPGWGATDHQGRLPAIMRAVDADMVALHVPVLHLEGRHATRKELQGFHDPAYLERVRGWSEEARARAGLFEVSPGLTVSGATWAASIAAAGSVLEALSAVLAGTVRNAFCAVRPPGRDAGIGAPGSLGFLNPIGVSLHWLVREHGLRRVLVVEWGDSASSGPHVAGEGAGVVRVPFPGGPDSHGDSVTAAGGLERVAAELNPEVVLLSAGFDTAQGIGPAVDGSAVEEATRSVMAIADRFADGRLVSILEGGDDARALGRLVVRHVRALSGVEAPGR